MKSILVLLISFTFLAGCKSTDQLKPISQITPGIAKEGTLANMKLISDATIGLEGILGRNIGESELLKFVIQQPVGQTGSRSWREMWIVKSPESKTEFMITFKEAGLGAAGFEIQQMNDNKCPESVSDFKEGQDVAFIKKCLGNPDNINNVNGSLKLTHFTAKNDKVKLTHP
jgi:hypothetical protein